ncbi:hypothetical protein ONE63_006362 [Megalurothrips usitatus]|uniref:Neurotransmitter-gated ion-channel ligand-binding domain-containing protein n=1 Tax=Megalurothrips usitatus TaxID=439358 RepID=A0AAV7XX37_9NEOP|nr:hypothetical protein ONE63_006362 [Megalurothrips usitatus]
MKCDSSPGPITSAVKKVHSDILCEYDTALQPGPVVDVTVELFVRRAKVVKTVCRGREGPLQRWTDRFLQWDPALYDNVQDIQLSSEEIWVPPIVSVSTLPWEREDDNQAEALPWPAVCHVRHDGAVTCSSAFDMGGACVVSFFYWPHTEASCAAFVGTDFRTDKNISVSFYNESAQAELSSYIPDSNWVVTEVKRESFTFSDDMNAMTYQFQLHARGALIMTSLLGPAVVLSLLMLVSFCLPAHSYCRLGLCCCSVFGTALASSLLFETLPPYNGPDPVIVKFYSGLLALSAIAIILPLIINIMVPQSRKTPVAPRWLYSFQSWLTNSLPGKIWLHLLFMTPHQSGDIPAPGQWEEDRSQDEPRQDDAPSYIRQREKYDGLGPHRIWSFASSFLNRSMFCLFLFTSVSFCLVLVHSMTMYEDVDFGYID